MRIQLRLHQAEGKNRNKTARSIYQLRAQVNRPVATL